MNKTFPRVMDFTARVIMKETGEELDVEVKGVEFDWNPVACSMDSAAHWKALRWLSEQGKYEWFGLKHFSTKPA